MDSNSNNRFNFPSGQPLDKTFVEGSEPAAPFTPAAAPAPVIPTPAQQQAPVPIDRDVQPTPLQTGASLNLNATSLRNPYEQPTANQPKTATVRQFSPEYSDSALPDNNTSIELGSGKTVSVLGAGGMAKVYKIWNEKLEVHRAVKVMLPGQAKEHKSRFETEAKITAKLHHTNIVEIYAVGEWNGLPFLEMEYIDGQSLESLVTNVTRLPAIVCCAVSICIARALAYAHVQEVLLYGKKYQGIIHRDLKPANIMINSQGRIVLMDFGIARPSETSLHTVEGNIVGTLQYLSPEQIDGVDIDHRADIYAFGAILYELITGAKAFPQNTITNLMKKKITNEYRRFSDFDFSLDPGLTKVSQRCLQFSRDDRYRDAESLHAELEKLFKNMSREKPETVLKQYLDNPEGFSISTKRPAGKKLTKTHLLGAIAGGVVVCGGIIMSVLMPHRPIENASAPVAQKYVAPVAPKAEDIPVATEQPYNAQPPAEQQVAQIPAPVQKQVSLPPTTVVTKPAPTSKQTVAPVATAQNSQQPASNQAAQSPLDKLVKKYGTTDYYSIGTTALSKKFYTDAALALENVMPDHPKYQTVVLGLLEAYLYNRSGAKAMALIERSPQQDAWFDILSGQAYRRSGNDKKAIECFQSAMTKPSIARQRQEIRDDALYFTASLYNDIHKRTPSSEGKTAAIAAWRAVKGVYSGRATDPRYLEATAEMDNLGKPTP